MNLPPISLTGLQTADELIVASPGDSICGTARRAIREAKRLHAPVKFEFNGDLAICSATDRPEQVEALYLQTLHERRALWEASPEGQAAAERDRREALRKQTELDVLLACLVEHVDQGLDATLGWLELFTPAADWGGLEWDRPWVAGQLERISPSGIHVGRTDLKEHPCEMGEWIVGQAADSIRHGGSPHPMLAEFVRRWREL